MVSRYRMNTNDNGFIEMPLTATGHNFLLGLRKGRSDIFKGQRIKDVIQAEPSVVTLGVIHSYT